MSVSEKHPLWRAKAWEYQLIRDSLEGESQIKFRSETYLPIPAGMLNLPPAPSIMRNRNHTLAQPEYMETLSSQYNPNAHPIEAYASYKSRATYPNLVSFLYRGLMGLANANEPSVQLPPELEYLEAEYAIMEGLTLSELFIKTLGEVLLTGRYTHLVDPVETLQGDRLLFVEYRAEQFINWKSFKNIPTMSVFNERITKPNDNDPFTHEIQDTFHVPNILTGEYENWFYAKDGTIPTSTVTPSFKGKILTAIPMTIFGSMNNTLKPDPAPLAPVANNALQIYMKNADLAQSEFLSANPTLIITGASDQDSPVQTGPTVALRFSNPQAKVYWTTTDTSALEFVHQHIQSIYEESILYGAQLLESKHQNESAETARLRHSSASATLRSVVTTVGAAIEKELILMAQWMGLSQAKIDQIQFKPLTDFGIALTPQEQEVLVESWLAGAISHMTVLTNFKQAGLLGQGRTEEDELEQIDEEGPPGPEETNDESESDSESSTDENADDSENIGNTGSTGNGENPGNADDTNT